MSGAFAIGIDVGGTQVRAARIGRDGALLDWCACATARAPGEVAAQMLELCERLGVGDAIGLGIGVPGRVDTRTGDVLSGGYVDFSGFALKAWMERALGKPVRIDNDGTMALIGEAGAGAARGLADVVLFTIGTGIGGGILSASQPQRGHRTAGQVGHIAVEAGGLRCLCGRDGCVETTSSGTALHRHIAEAGLPPETRADDLLDQAEAGDTTAQAVMTAWAAPMRRAIDSVSALLDPELVLLGGGLGGAMARALKTCPASSPWYRCDIREAALGDRAGVVGAGLAAFSAVAP
jgi:glucokinase